MRWSISDSKTFKRCQRQWYYKTIAGNAISRDPARRELYLLSKLQSISAWRGQLVDSIISETVIPAVRQRRAITLENAKSVARNLMSQQLACAHRHELFAEGFSPAALGVEFAALHCMEYRGSIDQSEVEIAKAEVEAALRTFFQLTEVKDIMKRAKYLVAQRALMFSAAGVTVRAVPDLIAFFSDRAPVIFDWKVHVFGIDEAWLQLATYALALTRCKPHKDFPLPHGSDATKIELVEVQLLTNTVRRYTPTEEELQRAEDYIAATATEMLLATGGRKAFDLSAEDFAVARFGNTCESCPFKKVCWERSV
jgi:hypothetical protein